MIHLSNSAVFLPYSQHSVLAEAHYFPSSRISDPQTKEVFTMETQIKKTKNVEKVGIWSRAKLQPRTRSSSTPSKVSEERSGRGASICDTKEVDEIRFAAKKPKDDPSPVNTNKQWFVMVSLGGARFCSSTVPGKPAVRQRYGWTRRITDIILPWS